MCSLITTTRLILALSLAALPFAYNFGVSKYWNAQIIIMNSEPYLDWDEPVSTRASDYA